MDQCHSRNKQKQGRRAVFRPIAGAPADPWRPTWRGRSDRLRVDGRSCGRIRWQHHWHVKGRDGGDATGQRGAITSPADGDGGSGWGKSGIVDAAGILVGMFAMSAMRSRSSRATPGGAGGNLPQRSVIVGVGPPSASARRQSRPSSRRRAGATANGARAAPRAWREAHS